MGVITGDGGYRKIIGLGPKLRYPVKPTTGICDKCGESTQVELGSYSINNNLKTGMVCKDCKEEK